MENPNEQAMQQTVVFFQQQQAIQQHMNLEDWIQNVQQSVIEKLNQLKCWDVSKFYHAYEWAMEDNGIRHIDTFWDFHLVPIPQIWGWIEELQEQHDDSWHNFKEAMKVEYFLEDFQRVTKQTFHEWVQTKNKGSYFENLKRSLINFQLVSNNLWEMKSLSCLFKPQILVFKIVWYNFLRIWWESLDWPMIGMKFWQQLTFL